MIDAKKAKLIVECLRCTTKSSLVCKETCPYRNLEPVDKSFPVPPDVTIDGQDYWVGCNCDKVVTDAADLIEEVLAENEQS